MIINDVLCILFPLSIEFRPFLVAALFSSIINLSFSKILAFCRNSVDMDPQDWTSKTR